MSGVIVDISPSVPLSSLMRAVRSVLREVRGEAAGTYRQPKPHISLAYAHTTADSDPWQSALRRVDPNHAPLTLTEIHLVTVHADPMTAVLEWTSVAAPIHLATG